MTVYLVNLSGVREVSSHGILAHSCTRAAQVRLSLYKRPDFLAIYLVPGTSGHSIPRPRYPVLAELSPPFSRRRQNFFSSLTHRRLKLSKGPGGPSPPTPCTHLSNRLDFEILVKIQTCDAKIRIFDTKFKTNTLLPRMRVPVCEFEAWSWDGNATKECNARTTCPMTSAISETLTVKVGLGISQMNVDSQ